MGSPKPICDLCTKESFEPTYCIWPWLKHPGEKNTAQFFHQEFFRAIDGNHNGDAQNEVNYPFATADAVEFPWFQVDFANKKLVKAVHIYA